MEINKDRSSSLIAHGVSTCAGCSLEIIIRKVLKILGENTIIVIPPGCAALFSGYGATTTLKIPGFQCNLGNTAAIATGIRNGLDQHNKKDINVLAFAGDGATADIGLQSLSAMFERGDKVIYICYDNEAYMNTGKQASSSTSYLSKTSTTPVGKETHKKDMLKIAIAHDIPYVASASPAYLTDLEKKILKAKSINGPSYIHIHSPCPSGWGFDPSQSINIAKLAVKSGAWFLFEYENGKYRIARKLLCDMLLLKQYLKKQGRFSHLVDEDLLCIQNKIENNLKNIQNEQNT